MSKKKIVKLLDEPARFAAIKSGKKLATQLNKQEKTKYSQYLRLVRDGAIEGIPKDIDAKKIVWVKKYRNELESYLNKRYGKGNKNTYSSHTGMLAKILLAIDKDMKAIQTQVRRLLTSSVQEKKAGQVERDESVFTERELNNIICYPELLKMRKELETKWNMNLKNKRANIKHLMLALVTLVPPLRRTYTMEITDTKPDEDDMNYLWKKGPNDYVFVINKDKVSERGDKDVSGRTEFDLSVEIPGVTNGKQLNKIIEKSLLHYPREYLFQHSKYNRPLSASGISDLIRSISKKLNINLIRKIYVNHFYRQDHSIGTLKQISARMRHDHRTALEHYYKINYKCFVSTQSKLIDIMNKMIDPDEIKALMDEYKITFDENMNKFKIV